MKPATAVDAVEPEEAKQSDKPDSELNTAKWQIKRLKKKKKRPEMSQADQERLSAFNDILNLIYPRKDKPTEGPKAETTNLKPLPIQTPKLMALKPLMRSRKTQVSEADLSITHYQELEQMIKEMKHDLQVYEHKTAKLQHQRSELKQQNAKLQQSLIERDFTLSQMQRSLNETRDQSLSQWRLSDKVHDRLNTTIADLQEAYTMLKESQAEKTLLMEENHRLKEMQNSKLSIDYYVFGFIGLLASAIGLQNQANYAVSRSEHERIADEDQAQPDAFQEFNGLSGDTGGFRSEESECVSVVDDHIIRDQYRQANLTTSRKRKHKAK